MILNNICKHFLLQKCSTCSNSFLLYSVWLFFIWLIDFDRSTDCAKWSGRLTSPGSVGKPHTDRQCESSPPATGSLDQLLNQVITNPSLTPRVAAVCLSTGETERSQTLLSFFRNKHFRTTIKTLVQKLKNISKKRQRSKDTSVLVKLRLPEDFRRILFTNDTVSTWIWSV